MFFFVAVQPQDVPAGVVATEHCGVAVAVDGFRLGLLLDEHGAVPASVAQLAGLRVDTAAGPRHLFG